MDLIPSKFIFFPLPTQYCLLDLANSSAVISRRFTSFQNHLIIIRLLLFQWFCLLFFYLLSDALSWPLTATWPMIKLNGRYLEYLKKIASNIVQVHSSPKVFGEPHLKPAYKNQKLVQTPRFQPSPLFERRKRERPTSSSVRAFDITANRTKRGKSSLMFRFTSWNACITWDKAW